MAPGNPARNGCEATPLVGKTRVVSRPMFTTDVRFGWYSLLILIAACFFGVIRGHAADATPRLPTIFILGDSTARTSGSGKNGTPMTGWGTPLADYFDTEKTTVANVAHAGTSSRTYFNNPNDWPRVAPLIQAGDFVLLVFGINDGGPPRTVAARGSIPGIGAETAELKRADGTIEIAHTYGWYVSAMATAARNQGARVFLLTVTTRNMWTNPKAKFRDATPTEPLPADYDAKDDRIERGTADGKYTRWTKEVGEKLNLPVLDLTNLCADRFEKMGRETVDKFYSDHNHTYAAGADFIAAAIVSGLKAFNDGSVLPLLSAKGKNLPPAEWRYVSDNVPPTAK